MLHQVFLILKIDYNAELSIKTIYKNPFPKLLVITNLPVEISRPVDVNYCVYPKSCVIYLLFDQLNFIEPQINPDYPVNNQVSEL